MLCDLCLKNNATIHIQEVINGNERAGHYCGLCAAKKGIKLHSFGDHGVAKCVFSISSVADKAPDGKKSEESHCVVCSECSTTSEKFQETGRLGCEACYDTFGGILNEILTEIHRGSVHLGKTPTRSGGDKTHRYSNQRKENVVAGKKRSEVRAILCQELKKAVSVEDFELAAFLRDQLCTLENKPSEFSFPGDLNASKKTN